MILTANFSAREEQNKPTYVILAAGRGSRLWPITEDIPKAMVRVLKKPLLEWIIEGVLPHASKIVVVVGYKRGVVENYFSLKPYASKLVFCEQKEQLGTGHALACVEEFVGEWFVTLNGDNFFDPKVFDLIAREAASQKPFSVVKKIEDVHEYGVVLEKNGVIAEIIEKPAEGGVGLVNTNTFFLPKKFFEYLRRLPLSERREYELTAAINDFVKAESVRLVEFDGYWNDIGFFWNYLQVNSFALSHLASDSREGIVEDGVVVKGKLVLGKGSVIRAPSRIEGPVFIGENSVIGPNAFLRAGATIEDHCHVGSSEVKNSILMSYSNAPHYSYVGDSVLCEDVNLGAGTTTANLRFNDANIPVFDQKSGKKIDSKCRKLGCVIGAGTRVGINASLNCGIAIGKKCRIYPHTFVASNLPDEASYTGEASAFGELGKPGKSSESREGKTGEASESRELSKSSKSN